MVSLASLKKLAEVRAEFSLPRQLPVSHAMQDAGESDEEDRPATPDNGDAGSDAEFVRPRSIVQIQQPQSDTVGQMMEIQGCDPDECEYVCTTCPWEACVVTAENPNGTFDVKISIDGTICTDIVAHRSLRLPGKRARR